MDFLVLVVQHGEKARLPGDPGLTEAGRVQAEATAEWLHAAQAVTRVVSSPLRRAVETAELIAERFGLEVSTDDRLRERMNWEGAALGSVEEFLAEWSRASEDRSFVPRSGDSSLQPADRFIAAQRVGGRGITAALCTLQGSHIREGAVLRAWQFVCVS